MFMLENDLSNKEIPWRRRSLGMAVAGSHYGDSQSANKHRQDIISRIRLCSVRGDSIHNLAVEIYSLINNVTADCEGMTTCDESYGCPSLQLKASVWQHAQKPKSKLKFVTLVSEHERAVATRRVSNNMQHGKSGKKGKGNRSDRNSH